MEQLIIQHRPWILRVISVRTWKYRINPNKHLFLILGSFLAYLIVLISLLTLFFNWPFFYATRHEGVILPFFRIRNISDNILEWDFAGLDIFVLLFQVVGFLCLFIYYISNAFTGHINRNKLLVVFQLFFTVIWIFLSLTMIYPPWGPDVNFFESSSWGLWVGIMVRRWSISPLERWIHFFFFPIFLFIFLYGAFWSIFRGKWLQSQYQSLLQDLEAHEQSLLLKQLSSSALPLQTLMNILEIDNEEDLFMHLYFISMTQSLYPVRIKPNFVTLSKLSYNCQLCKNDFSLAPFWQCSACGRYICADDYTNLQQTTGEASPHCLECQGDFISLPGSCQGCKSYVLDATLLNKSSSCSFCGHRIHTYDEQVLSFILKDQNQGIDRQNTQKSSLKSSKNDLP